MTPEEHDLIFSLVTVPGRETVGSQDDILRHYETADGRALGLRLLQNSVADKSSVDLEAALIVCNAFGVGMEHYGLLAGLVSADWHQQHESAVAMIGSLRIPESVSVLRHAAIWVPDYLDWDENRALATKAIWALGGTPGLEAKNVLLELYDIGDEIVREEAKGQLIRRNSAPGEFGDSGDS
ncbi:hypothetical protein [Amycolatopsis sp. cmx-11-32]|uniref:hypothetical protein n=1 Tax=Amycolatopsis sp. cmx-11-32 TaxID=2785796 RepID=UPI0039E3C146